VLVWGRLGSSFEVLVAFSRLWEKVGQTSRSRRG
jgi:hypothetical protein